MEIEKKCSNCTFKCLRNYKNLKVDVCRMMNPLIELPKYCREFTPTLKSKLKRIISKLFRTQNPLHSDIKPSEDRHR